MKDKFFVYQPDGQGCSEFVAFDGAFGESILDAAECVKMLNGFNSTCDANQALITKQTEQIKMLRECLELSITFLPFDAVVETKASQALEATKSVEE